MKPCKSNQIRNPATNRCVKKSGAVGKKLSGKPARRASSNRKAPAGKAPARRASSPARKAQARRASSPARKAPARRASSPARKAPARRASSPARKAPARRASPSARRTASPSKPARRGNTGRCERQVEPHVSPSIARKYAGRPSPPFPANECCGMVLTGNDGNKWTSTKNAKGICQWKKVTTGGARAGGYLGIPYN